MAHLDEEKTHRLSIDLDEDAGTIDLFVTISGIAPIQETTNDSQTLSNIDLDVVPSKIRDEDIQHYVCIVEFYSFVLFHF